MRKYIYWTAILFFICFVLVPVLWAVISSLINTEQIGVLLNKNTFQLIGKSIAIAGISASIATVMGLPLGFLLGRTDLPHKKSFKLFLLIPLLVSPYILAVAWKDFFFLAFSNPSAIENQMGVVFVLTTVFSPLAMLILESAFGNINAKLEEAGLMVTHSRQVFFKITLPLVKPAVISSWVLIFILSISEFSVPAFYGVNVLTTEIFTQFSAFYNHELAILQSLLLVAICVLLLFSEISYLSDAPFLSVSSKGSTSRLVKLGRGKGIALALVTGFGIIAFLLPVLVLCIQSFNGGGAQFVEAFFYMKPVILNSIFNALMAASAVCLLSIPYAYMAEREKSKSIDWMLLITFAIPSTVLGISLIKFYNDQYLQFIYSGVGIIMLGYIGKFTFIATKITGNALKQIPKGLEDAAWLMGANFWMRWWYITLPLIAKAVFAAFMLVFILCLGELGYTIMVYPPGTSLMPIKVFTIMANAPQSITSGMVLITLMVTLLMLLILFVVKMMLDKKFGYDKV